LGLTNGRRVDVVSGWGLVLGILGEKASKPSEGEIRRSEHPEERRATTRDRPYHGRMGLGRAGRKWVELDG